MDVDCTCLVWSWCVRLSAPPCAPLFGPRVSAVRRPFPPCFIYMIAIVYNKYFVFIVYLPF